MNKLAERDKQWEQALKYWETTTHCEQGRFTLEQIEAAMKAVWEDTQGHLGYMENIAAVIKRLQPKEPTLQEQIKTMLQEAHRVSDDFDTTASEIMALVRQEIGAGK